MTRRPTEVWKTSTFTRRRTLRTNASRAPWPRRATLVRRNPPDERHDGDVDGADTVDGADCAEGVAWSAWRVTRIVRTPSLSLVCLSTRRKCAGAPWPWMTYV